VFAKAGPVLIRAGALTSVLVVASAWSIVCSPHLPPTTVPAARDPGLEPFRSRLQTYVDETQPFRKQAAQAAEQVPGKAAAATGAEASVRTRQNVLLPSSALLVGAARGGKP
jgi:hypothetical protein